MHHASLKKPVLSTLSEFTKRFEVLCIPDVSRDVVPQRVHNDRGVWSALTLLQCQCEAVEIDATQTHGLSDGSVILDCRSEILVLSGLD